MKKIILVNIFKMKIAFAKFKMEMMKKQSMYENVYYVQNLITVDSEKFDKYVEDNFDYLVKNKYGLGHALMMFKKDFIALMKMKVMNVLTK